MYKESEIRIYKCETEISIDDINRYGGNMKEDDIIRLKNIVDNPYNKEDYCTVEELSVIENVDKSSILKSLKKYEVPMKRMYQNGTRAIIIIHKNDVEEYIKNKYKVN